MMMRLIIKEDEKMKLIVAMVKPEKVPDVKDELFKQKIYMMTLVDVSGCGQQKGFVEEFRGVISETMLRRKVMLLVAVNDSYVKKTIDAIMAGGRTGKGTIGDGKIFVLPMDECIRIRNGDRGVLAIGGDSIEVSNLKKRKDK
jgi:nitrogen regulatory protein P-II 2